jgi:hypothetical protein
LPETGKIQVVKREIRFLKQAVSETVSPIRNFLQNESPSLKKSSQRLVVSGQRNSVDCGLN